MFHKLSAVASGAMLSLMLSGCTMTAAECDPSSDPGFFNKIGCTVAGSYSERVETKEENLKALQAENERLQRIQTALNNEDALVRGSMEERQRQLSSIQSEVDALKDALASRNQLSESLNEQIASLEKQLQEMQNTPAKASILQKQAELGKLKQQYEELSALAL